MALLYAKDLMSRNIILMINQEIAIHAIAIPAVASHFFHLVAFLLSAPDDRTKNQLYIMKINVTRDNIAKIRFIAYCMSAKA